MFSTKSWIKQFGGSRSPKSDWNYLVCSACRHHLLTINERDQGVPIAKRQIWMSNFSLKPLALECKTLTDYTLEQGALWSLIGSAHDHVVLEEDSVLPRSCCIAWNADIYTAEVCELYTACLAKALVS
jgi:hypothetical protein